MLSSFMQYLQFFPRKRISFNICHTGSNIQRSYVDHCLFPRISKDLLQTYCMRLCIMPNMSIVSNHIKVMSITCTMCQYGSARQIQKICAYNLNCVIYDTLSTSSFYIKFSWYIYILLPGMIIQLNATHINTNRICTAKMRQQI